MRVDVLNSYVRDFPTSGDMIVSLAKEPVSTTSRRDTRAAAVLEFLADWQKNWKLMEKELQAQKQ